MDIGKAIKHTRKTLGLTQEELGKKIGVGKSSVSMWESGANPPSGKSLRALADALNVSVAYLLGESESPRYTILPGAITPKPSEETAFLPLLGRVHAGDAQDPDILDDKIELPLSVAKRHPRGYFLKVEGNCMSKVYPEGCFILIDPMLEPTNGSIAVFSINGADYVMRKLYRGANTLILSPDSYEDGYEDIVIANSDDYEVKFVGTVVWFQAAKELE